MNRKKQFLSVGQKRSASAITREISQRADNTVLHKGQGSASSMTVDSSRYAEWANVICGYCHKAEHLTFECWRANKKCLGCGSSDHWLFSCSRYRGPEGAAIALVSQAASSGGFQQTQCNVSKRHAFTMVTEATEARKLVVMDLEGVDLQTGFFTLRQIKAATRNFDAENKIGEGGFGSVYKGILKDGTIIAVKQLSSRSMQGNREFVNEIGMISALQHPNLVKLHGCCTEGNQLLLIYEYMEHNCLARVLFDKDSQTRLKLDWPTRRKICIGIARGLPYLHEGSRLKIVHRDIKASNVLLDRDLNAKISGFGLAKLNEDDHTHISTRVAGTIGYMAPDYAMCGHLTVKADVYSFGVVALEIVSGKSNTNYQPKENLLDWACVLQEKGTLLELVDPELGSEYSKEEATIMLSVALLCINASPTLRPTMSKVVSILEGETPLQPLLNYLSFMTNGLSNGGVGRNFGRTLTRAKP